MSKKLPEKLTTLRLIFGLTQNEIADYLGKSRTSITHYETGRYVPTIETVKRLVEFYAKKGIDIRYEHLFNDSVEIDAKFIESVS